MQAIMTDYGFEHAGKIFTPNQTPGLQPEANAERNATLTAAELALWKSQPARQLAYYDVDEGVVTTWTGEVLGTIVLHKVYRHNLGGRMVSVKVRGSNGARYHGCASYDWGTCIWLRKTKGGR